MRSLIALLMFLPTVAAAKPLFHFTLVSDQSNADARVPFMGIAKARVSFPDMSGELSMWPDRPDAFEFHVKVDAKTIRASNQMMTRIIKGRQFFDVQNHPLITFNGTGFKLTSDTTAAVTGDMTARGMTRPVEMTVTFASPPAENDGHSPIDFTASTQINRREFGMNAYPVIVGNIVKILIKAQMRPD